MKVTLLKILQPAQLKERLPEPVDPEAEEVAREVALQVKNHGDTAVREYALRFGDIQQGEDLIVSQAELKRAFDGLDPADIALLERTAARIEKFAIAQLESISSIEVPIKGGVAGHEIAPMIRAGCYAPGGRFPLPSSVLMTAVTARAAGVKEVWVSSPKPQPITLAAAYIAGVDGFIRAGGAQGIAAFAYGAGDIPPCDVIVGPGNKYVTAAKKVVSGQVAIDMLAGPSELTVLADDSADPAIVAADLLAQAEHDVDAVPSLVTTDAALVENVEAELASQLSNLPTAATAKEALKNGFAVLVDSIEDGVDICNRIGPEHLELLVRDSATVARQCENYGGLFVGEGTAEVLGDYGAGPNHTLPTGGTARYTGGLSVFDFLRIRTWIRVENTGDASELIEDARRLAELEGLVGHARSALARKK